jgi:hypothetical protein
MSKARVTPNVWLEWLDVGDNDPEVDYKKNER